MGGIRKSTAHISGSPGFLLFLLTEGMFLAQYKVLRENGHSPSEAFNETVEEATQSLFPLIGAKGYVPYFSTPLYSSLDPTTHHFYQDGLHVQRVLHDRASRCPGLGAHL